FPATVTLTLQPPADHALQHWWVNKGAGFEPETGGVFAESVSVGYAKTQRSGPYSEDGEDRDAIPWFSLHDVDGRGGVYGGIEFSGWTEIKLARPQRDKVELSMGMQVREDAGRTRLEPGKAYHYPACFVGAYQGEVDDGCNLLHRWVESHLRPPM